MSPFQQLIGLLQSPSFLMMFLVAWGVMYAVYKYYVVGHSGSYEEINYFKDQLQKAGYSLINADLIPTENPESNTSMWSISATDAQGNTSQLSAQVTYTDGSISNINWTPAIA